MSSRVLLMVTSIGLTACGGSSSPPAQSSGNTSSTPSSNLAASAGAASTSPAVETQPIDACGLLTKADVQRLLGRATLDGVPESIAGLSTCTYGNPDAPRVGGKSTDTLLSISVFRGPLPGQGREAFEIGKKNAAQVEAVAGLGDDAYWDEVLRGLRVARGNYELSVDIGADLGGLKTARAIGEQVLPKVR